MPFPTNGAMELRSFLRSQTVSVIMLNAPCFRELTIPEEWREAGRVRIHFEAVDYHTTVYIDKETSRNGDNS